MKQADVKTGESYTARISGNLVTVRIDRERAAKSTSRGQQRHGGWDATNLATNKKVHIKSAAKLRGKARGPKGASAKATAAADQENARLRDERAQSPDGQTASERAMAESPKRYDPDKCATPRCKGAPALTHLGKPLCQKCWEKQCAAETAVEAARADDAPAAPDVAVDAPTGNDSVGATPETEATAATTPATNAKPKRAKKAAKDGEPKPKRVSALDAAAQVLEASGQAMRTTEMIAAMAEQKLWTSPGGKTPHATLYSAILREIDTKGADARFRKVERGKFQFSGKEVA